LGPLGLAPLPARFEIRFGSPIFTGAFTTSSEAMAAQALAEEAHEHVRAMLRES
jgi:hypothetical protein